MLFVHWEKYPSFFQYRIILSKNNKWLFSIILIGQKVQSHLIRNKFIGMSDEKYPFVRIFYSNKLFDHIMSDQVPARIYFWSDNINRSNYPKSRIFLIIFYRIMQRFCTTKCRREWGIYKIKLKDARVKNIISLSLEVNLYLLVFRLKVIYYKNYHKQSEFFNRK